MKIFTKLFILVSILSSIALVLVSAYSYTFTKSSLQEHIGEDQRTNAEKAMETIDRMFYERYVDIQDIAQAQTFESYLFEQSIRSKEEAQQRLEEYKTLTGPWDFIQIADKAGKIVLSTSPEAVGIELGNNPFDDEAIQSALSGQIYYSDVHIDQSTGKPAIIFAAPVKNDETGAVIGVATGHLAWPVVSEIISNIQLPLLVHLHDKNGIMIAVNEPSQQSKLFQQNFKDHPVLSRALKGNEGFVVNQGIIKPDESLISFVTQDGHLGFGGNGWVLAVETPTAIAFAPATATAWKMVVIIGIIVLSVVFGIIFILQRSFIRPLVGLTNVVEEIGKGNLARRASVASKDEIGILGMTVNQMAASLWDSQVKLQEYSKGLEEKVAEKTKDLQNKVDELNKAREAVLNIAEDAEEEKQKTIREKDKIDAILYSIGDGVFVVDTNLKVILVNEVTVRMTGFTADEIMGAKYGDTVKFVFEDTGKINDLFIRKAIETKTIQEMANHTVLINKNGDKIQVADSAAPLIGKNNEVVGCVVVFRDVTRERQIDRAKTEFVSLASHQLRTPLSTVNWYAEMLLAGDAGTINTEQKKYLEEIYRGNQRMVELVNALLNVSRLELGTFLVEPVPTNIVKLAQDVISEQKPQISAKHIKLTEAYGDNIPAINADPKLLRMVFQNLLSNAVKYTPEQGKVSMNIHPENNDSIAISVADSGYGIPREQQDKIFSKLFRADNVREKDTEGTGLGLYIVKSIIDHSGGKIWFESEENKGTTFFVTLPLAGMKKKEGTKTLA